MDRSQPEYAEAIRYLYDRLNYEKTTDRPYTQQHYRLARMEALLESLGNPQSAAPVIHISGTKGKGSVAWLTAESLRRAGRRVGLYTSPHLEQLEERFVVNGVPVSPTQLVGAIDSIRKKLESWDESQLGIPTFFELTTAIAWFLFRELGCDVNVMEVGLGGRLDSTNVCRSLISVITSISFDHQAQLGNTIESIASEKAGIIKPGSHVIHGARHPDARRVIRDQAQSQRSELWELGTDFECHEQPKTAQQFDFQVHVAGNGLNGVPGVRLLMLGRHQMDNGSLAIAVCQKLNTFGWEIPESAYRQALEETQIPSRIELVSRQPDIIVDAAHNIASISSLIEALQTAYPTQKKTIVFASSKDKDYIAMLHQLMGFADQLIVTQYSNNPRFVPVELLEEEAKKAKVEFPKVDVLSATDSGIAMEYVRSQPQRDGLICFTGSFFLAAEVREALRNPFQPRRG
ncbi:Folylpolyglutamate synthase [Pirellula sp. SH-Sr6A]|uniref:bifunctional folylpolyglutamate synthase/dihydrofolate synthase n=1 Tax=Pirellula sp. SH-Sr6A TaxID=1632865 RepID=UPI00078E2917|nr:folylpolyglutamate synthase/dihydrofolate synthase family protein [Pirellula sp. SH-Sr6A]AMV35500.1 Folylpolyglutamate synthase [Pirellula sp. SH-Sr6A]